MLTSCVGNSQNFKVSQKVVFGTACGGKLLFWIRINPKNFNDPKNLSKPYRDAIPHGNRQIILNEENFDDIMNLIRQSYEFRKQDNFNELYKKAVLDEFGKIN